MSPTYTHPRNPNLTLTVIPGKGRSLWLAQQGEYFFCAVEDAPEDSLDVEDADDRSFVLDWLAEVDPEAAEEASR